MNFDSKSRYDRAFAALEKPCVILKAVKDFYTAKRRAHERWPELPWPSAEERRAMAVGALHGWYDKVKHHRIARGTAIGKAEAAMWRKLDAIMEDK